MLKRVNPMLISYGQLRAMVDSTVGAAIPSEEALSLHNRNALFSVEHKDVSLTVFGNGFFIYRREGLAVVYAVDRCRCVLYLNPRGELLELAQSDFRNGPCIVPLCIKAENLLNGNATPIQEDPNGEYYAMLEEAFRCRDFGVAEIA